jgi:hypothetical protein
METVLAGGSDSEMETTISLLTRLDSAFVVIFAVELAVSLYSRWFWPFVHNKWCLFDLFVVSLSLIGLLPLGLPFNLLLLFRCVRVLRILGRFRTIQKILSILLESFFPMISAFFIIFLISSICELFSHFSMYAFTSQPSRESSMATESCKLADAIAGVAFFSHQPPGHFDTFSRAFVSMFRVTIGSVDWWCVQQIMPVSFKFHSPGACRLGSLCSSGLA